MDKIDLCDSCVAKGDRAWCQKAECQYHDLWLTQTLQVEVERVLTAHARTAHEVEQTLGKALGYAPLYPDASEEDDGQVNVGEHVPETIALEAARRISQTERTNKILRAALQAIAARGIRPGPPGIVTLLAMRKIAEQAIAATK